MEVDIQRLIRQRASLKGKITRTLNFANSINDETSVFLIRSRLEAMITAFNEYDTIQTTLEIEDDAQSADRINTEQDYFNAKSLCDEAINNRDSKDIPNVSPTNSSKKSSKIKLPEIKLPIFNGTYSDWRHYKDIFSTLILDNENLSDIQKFHYLLGTLTNEPSSLIKNLAVTEANFNVAFNLLCERYDNKRLIASEHINTLLNLPNIAKANVPQLRELLSTVQSNYAALKTLQADINIEELLLTQLVLNKLTVNLKTEFEAKQVDIKDIQLQSICDFLKNKIRTLELVQSSGIQNSSVQSEPKPDVKNKFKPTNKQSLGLVSTNQTSSTNCVLCKGCHALYKCDKFLEMSTNDRFNVVKNNKACTNCLKTTHNWRKCKSKNTCSKCQKYHHTLLHRSVSQDECKSEPSHSKDSETVASTYCSFQTMNNTQVLLTTTLVEVIDSSNKRHTLRAVLDNGSQSNFITQSAVQRLKLKRSNKHITLQGFNGMQSRSSQTVDLSIHSIWTDYETNITCVILPKITGKLPSEPINVENWNLPMDLDYADPQFNVPQQIDLLLGAQVFYDILKQSSLESKVSPGPFPMLLNTSLGWVVGGQYRIFKPVVSKSCERTAKTLFIQTTVSLEQQVQRFWETEELNQSIFSKEELQCEQHFLDHTTKDADGRFIVKLPLKTNSTALGDSKTSAKRRFLRLEHRLQNDDALNKEYIQFMREYEQLGHMQKVEITADEDVSYYLPHHPVFKPSSTTTKMRVVFDASAKTSTGLSLNDILRVGPTIQQDLWSILLRFRTHDIAFVADIAKMYRQVKMHTEHQNLQKILWRENPKEPLQEYRLTTVTYGTSSASFLATRCLVQIANENAELHPNAAQAIREDFYMDDAITGSDNLQEAIQLQRELTDLLQGHGFELRKWASNSLEFLETIPKELRETKHSLELTDSEVVKTLGLSWNPVSDKLHIHAISNSSNKEIHPITKRSILSSVASIFDPLGLVAPIVITGKILLQELWQEKISWDQPVSPQLQEKWLNFYQQLPLINDVTVNRQVLEGVRDCQDIQCHGFSDASEKAYGACIYVRYTINGITKSRLLCAKTKVAPLKKLTVPRLELCAAHLLSKLTKRVLEKLSLSFSSIYLWTDSTIVLAWISKCPTKWKTFVANRVASIQDNTSNCIWQHVTSEDNPADLLSRGLNPNQLHSNTLWWNGPCWLSQSTLFWPKQETLLPNEPIIEQRALLVTVKENPLSKTLSRFSKLSKLQRVLAYCLRFVNNCRSSSNKRNFNQLSTTELHAALLCAVRISQEDSYPRERHDLSNNVPLSSKSTILSLSPYLDQDNILRVGGRLQHSTLPSDNKHQMILHPSHHLTKLIIESEHLRLLHAGPQLLLMTLRQRFWIVRARQVIRAILHHCLPCFRMKAENAQQLMGSLPAHRVQQARPFLHVGVDYAGPIYLKTGTRRSKTKLKGYIAVFICLSTKAVHLEVVSDLSSTAFIAALRRFIARRGISQHIYSDNGTNFVGANRQLKELRELLLQEMEDHQIEHFLQELQCQWHFIPPNAPHFGGLWEAAVKSFKFHLRRVIGLQTLTFEEMTTLVQQIEACLNSRPLSAMSDDPTDFLYLTPGHFLIGQPLTALPEPTYLDTPINRLSQWQQIQQLTQRFWKHWKTDYLNNLQQRQKWLQSTKVLPGTLVLLKDDQKTPLQWKIARIIAVHPGTDGLVRVVTLRTADGLELSRPLTKTIAIPCDSLEKNQDEGSFGRQYVGNPAITSVASTSDRFVATRFSSIGGRAVPSH